MMDFTLSAFSALLKSLKECGYSFQPYVDFIRSPREKSIILRHDVDRLPRNSLITAEMERSFGIAGTYYFRSLPHLFNEKIINRIALLGHEIGYHYEDLALCHGDFHKAYQSFCSNLERLRKLQPVQTITMHGSPLSKWDNRHIWDHYSYKKMGILGEPYFDIDFTQVLYLTDTSRHWNDFKVIIRDKSVRMLPENLHKAFNFHKTQRIIDNAKENKLPSQIMMTIHPQRWSNDMISWTRELIMQSFKNIAKRVVVSFQQEPGL